MIAYSNKQPGSYSYHEQPRDRTKTLVRFHDNIRQETTEISGESADIWVYDEYTIEVETRVNMDEYIQNHYIELHAEAVGGQSAIQSLSNSIDAISSMSNQLCSAARMYVQAATNIPDETALEMPSLFKTWEEALASGEMLAQNSIINDGGTLYRVVTAVTPQEHQPPHSEGMLAVYRPIDQTHTGTQDDPVPWVYGMDCTEGTYYSYGGAVYLCKADMKPCTWAPDTAGLWQWEKVV